MPAPKSKLLGITVAELLQVGCPSWYPTNSVKTSKPQINETFSELESIPMGQL